MLDTPERRARALFGGISARYDRPAALLSFGRYGAWRRALVRALPMHPGARVLDVATGTGLIARDLERAYGVRAVGLDQSESMLHASGRSRLVGGSAVALPFPDASFDVVVFSYLLRYVPDPEATLVELARVLRPDGAIGTVEFGVPGAAWARFGWRLYARGAFPLLARAFGPGWREVGGFLPGSIQAWARDWPVERQRDAWRAAGLTDVRVRCLTFGTGVVMVGRKHGDRA